MAALLGLDRAAAEEVAALAADGEVIAVANDNAPGQCVVSGHRGAVERAMEIARGRGARRPMLLGWLGRKHDDQAAVAAAGLIQGAVTKVIADGKHLTRDLGGNASTTEMGDAIAAAVAR
jgi:[acyl-carrier-protein] S-malonyltransferase